MITLADVCRKTPKVFLLVPLMLILILLHAASASAFVTPKIAAGAFHSLALRADGTVVAWGHNGAGQLGDGTFTNSSTPVVVNGLSNVIAIAAGTYHSVALLANGTVVAWGDNYFGQLGNGSFTTCGTPVAVYGLTGVTAIAAGDSHTIALRSTGSAYTWGSNSNGQLGYATPSTVKSTPGVVSGGLNALTAIAAGSYHSVVRKSDGTVWAWGDNTYGQLGNSSYPVNTTPVAVSGLSGVSTVSAGNMHTVALLNTGTVVAFGDNFYGQLGNGTLNGSSSPVAVSGLSTVVAVQAGGDHTVARKSDGTLVVWGRNSEGQLGNGTTIDSALPVPVAGLSGVSAMAAGWYHTVALKTDGNVVSWGDNTSGQLGDGAFLGFLTSPAAISGLSGLTAVVAGGDHSVALTTNGTLGTVASFGNNGSGQLGNGTTLSGYTPVVPQISQVAGISAGLKHTVERSSTGLVLTWGDNLHGQLGDGTVASKSNPVRLPGLSGVTHAVAGDNHTLIRKGDGTIWAWGDNTFGQLGDGTLIQRNSPVAVAGLSGVSITAISAGGSHTLALKSDGTVLAWGNNSSGQLGNTSYPIISSTPVAVAVLSGVRGIYAGNSHSLALKTDGSLWAWGNNSSGQLGNGTFLNSSIPVLVSFPPGSPAVDRFVAAGFAHTMAMMSDGTVMAWGDNSHGQLGDGTTTSRNIPQLVPGLIGVAGATVGSSSYSGISAGNYFSVARKSDGTAVAWGDNRYGQLGVPQGSVLPHPALINLDNVNPSVSADLLPGTYPSALSVTLTCNDNFSGCAGIWYTLDGTAPTTAATPYSGPIPMAVSSTLLFMARDNAGNQSASSGGLYIVPAYYAITVSPGTNGSITPVGTTSVVQGGSLAYTISPAVGYHILDVRVDGVSVGAVGSYSFSNVTASHTISASFALNSYTITASAGPNGNITPAGTTSVSHGGSLIFTISPAANYHILDVLVDGVSVGAVSGYTFASVTGSHTISATFDLLGPGDIITVAGGGTGVASQATAAKLDLPSGMAFDDKGNFYIADTNNHLVLMVDPAGVITTVAGDGTAGYSGDGGAATQSSLYSPTGVTLDRNGNLYIADSSNNRIRMVDTSGKIATVAGDGSSGYYGDGGIAWKAGLNMPSAVAADGNGILYIADTKNSVIRMVDTYGNIYTAAGTGTQGYSGDGRSARDAELYAPFGVAVDGNGAFYIADSGNSVIRMVDSSGIITTVAGNGVPGYSGDGGPAWNARLNIPLSVAVDGVGALFIADTDNQRIRMVDKSGTITTVAGIGTPGFSGDGGPATAAQLYTPSGLAVNKWGTFYIADATNNRIRMVVSLTPDTTPNQFTFTDQGNAALNAAVISGTVVISGINAPAPLSISGGEYSINGGQFFTTAGVIANGDSLRLRIQASGSYATVRSATLQIGGVSDIFSVTTLSAPTYPVTAAPVTNGSITSSGGATVPQGLSKTFTIIPNSGYTLSGLTDNGASVTALVIEAPAGTFTYTVSNVTAPHSIAATFAPQSAATPVPALGPWGLLLAAGGLGLVIRRRRECSLLPHSGC